jgi:serine/threonine-protein kinase
MIEFRVLGSLDLRSALGVPADRVLSQPKRLALLAYLAASTPRGFHRRDSLLALFWPELDQEHARAALRNAIHFLRQELGPGVLTSRGDDVGLSGAMLWSDAAAFESAIENGDLEYGLSLYRGDLLKGLNLSAAPDFERWLDCERERMRRIGHTAACTLSRTTEEKGDVRGAVRWLHVALSVVPDDEVSLQRLMRVLDRTGDRAGAVREYEVFRDRLAAELEVEPSPESRTLVEGVRARTAAAARDGDVAVGLEAPNMAGSRAVPSLAEPPIGLMAGEGQGARTHPRSRALIALGGVTILAIVALGVATVAARHSNVEPVPTRVVIAPLRNETGRPQLDGIGVMAAEWITEGLIQTGLAEVVPPATALSAARSIQSKANGSHSPDWTRGLAEETRAQFVVSGTYYLEHDTLQFRAEILESGKDKLSAAIGPIAGPAGSPSEPIEDLRGRVLGAIAALLDPRDFVRLRPHGSIAYVRSLEGRREFREGLNLFLRQGKNEQSLEHFYRAFAIDTMDAGALLEAGFVHWSLGQIAQVDSIVARLTPSRSRMGEQERLWLGLWRARVAGNRMQALEVNRQQVRLLPRGGWEMEGGYQALSARRPREALDMLRGFDPDKGLLEGLSRPFELQAEALHVLGEHESELQIARRGHERHPRLSSSLLHEVQALAALGRIGEMRDRIHESLTYPPQSPSVALLPILTSGDIMSTAAAELRAHGNLAASRDLLDEAVRWFRGRLREDPGSESLMRGLGEALYLSGRWAESQILFQQLARSHPKHLDYRGYLGVLAARQGKRAQATAIGEVLRTWDQPYTFGLNSLWRARIAAQLGEHEQAVSLVHEAFAHGHAFGIALHRDVDLESLHQMASFRELLQPPG